MKGSWKEAIGGLYQGIYLTLNISGIESDIKGFVIRGWFSSRAPSLDVEAYLTRSNDSHIHLTSQNEIYIVVHTLTRETPPHRSIFT